MHDDRVMGTDIDDVDPILIEVVDALFGDAVDPREVWVVVSKQNDASEMHVKKPLQRETPEWQRKVALATNAAGAVAGPAAIAMAIKAGRKNEGGIPREGMRQVVGLRDRFPKTARRAVKAIRVMEKPGGKAAIAAGTVGVGLQIANWAGDATAAEALRHKKQEVKKVLDDIVDARRRGIITADQAIVMTADLVSKLETPDSKTIHREAEQLVPLLPGKGKKTAAKTALKMTKPLVQKPMAPSLPPPGPAPVQPIAKRKMLARYIGNIAEEASRKSAQAASAEAANTIGTGQKAAEQTIKQAEKSAKRVATATAAGLTVAGTTPVAVHYALKRRRDKQLAAPVEKSMPDLTWSGSISKMDTDKRQVFGFCTVTHVNGEPVIDRQGDYVPLEEIEKAAYTYVVESRKGGDMHARDGEQPLHTSDMIESVIITPEKLEKWGLEPDAMPYGWWVGFKVNDDKQWLDVKDGKRTAFSIHGQGKRSDKVVN